MSQLIWIRCWQSRVLAMQPMNGASLLSKSAGDNGDYSQWTAIGESILAYRKFPLAKAYEIFNALQSSLMRWVFRTSVNFTVVFVFLRARVFPDCSLARIQLHQPGETLRYNMRPSGM